MRPARFNPAPLAVAVNLALLASLSSQAHAQSSTPTPGNAEITLPEVTVTSAAYSEGTLNYLNKEETAGALGKKKVLDTPFSMTIVDSEEITERGARNIGQIFFRDAGVYTPTSSLTTDWWGTQIRGLPVRNAFIDDVPMLLHWGGDFPTEIIDSVTALKGLTGFMYGFGTPGGALSYKLKRPKQENDTSVTMNYRNPSLLGVHVDSSRKFEDDLAVRVNLATEHGTAYNESKIDRTVASLAFDKKIQPTLTWFTTLAYEDSKTEGEPFQFYLDQFTGRKLPTATYNYDNLNIDNAWYHTETTIASTGLQWQINDAWNLNYQLGVSRKNHQSNKAFATLRNEAGDYDGTMYNFAGQLDNYYTQAMLQGKVMTGSIKHEIVTGLGYQKSEDRWSKEWYWSNDFGGNIYRGQPFKVTRTPDFSLEPASGDTTQKSAFLSDTIHFNEQWQSILGLRYSDYYLKDSGYSASRTSPTLALIYKPNRRTSIYGSYIEALEPGSIVPYVAPPQPIYANQGEALDATISRQYEIGAKYASDSADYTAAFFKIERTNEMNEMRGADLYLAQNGLQIYQGIELAGAWQVTRNLNLGAGTVYLDASIEKTDNATVEGNAPAYAPEWQIVGNAEYKVPGMPGLELRGDVRYFGASYVTEANGLKVPGRTITNVGFSYDFRAMNHDLSLIGNVYNLFDVKYWAGGGWGAGNVGEARNFSLALKAQL